MRMITKENPLKILLIEDSKGDALLIKKALESSMPGATRIHCVTNLANGLKILAEHSFEVALLDRSLPDVDGFSGLHSIQMMAPDLPIIFLTAYQDEHIAFEAILQGAQDYLFKDKLDGHIVKRAIQYAILRKQFEDVLIVQANFDMLTGLANRQLFESRLDMALAKMKRQGGHVGALFLDLDRFKEVNDTLGHLAGDKLLKQVGTRLKEALRTYDTAARFGGDEFAVLLDPLVELNHAECVAEKIVQLFQAPFNVLGHTISLGISIGIACAKHPSTASRVELMAQADAAMYQAKAQNGSAYHFHPSARPHANKQSA